MKNSLPYESRKYEMDIYLNQLYQMHLNGGLNDSIIYNLLKNYNLKTVDYNDSFTKGKDIEYIFEIWKKRFESKKNTNAFRDIYAFPYFFQFVSKDFSNPEFQFTKFYIPLDIDHIEDGVNLLFDFFDKKGISHCSKVSKEIRSDDLIVRIDKKDTIARDLIIKFISNNRFIKKGLNRPNPFVPVVNNIGIMDEQGISYNREISYYIFSYFEYVRENGLDVSADNFRNYLLYCESNKIRFDNKKYINYELFQIFDTAFLGQNVELSIEQKELMFIDVLNDIFEKRGINGVISTLNEVIFDKNYSNIVFDNDNKFLIKEFINSLNISDILQIINAHVSSLGFDTINIEQNISIFARNIFSKKLSIEIGEICDATYKKYGKKQLVKALRDYLYYNKANSFTRGDENSKYNYRNRILTIDREFVLEFIYNSLKENGISFTDGSVDDYINNYVDLLSNVQDTNIHL